MTGPEPAARGDTLWSPLRYRDFALLWGGFMFSHVGDSVQVHAQAWLVTELTRSGFKVGMVALAQAVPRLFLGLFAGVLVDRTDRRRLLFVTQSLAMLQSVVFFTLVVTDHITYARIVVLAFMLGVFDTLNLNARVAMMPTLVPRTLIGKAVALQAMGINVVQISGPAIAGMLIGATGVAGCLGTNAATFIVLLAALAWMRAPPASGAAVARLGDDLREGFAFVRANPLLWASILLAYLIGFFGVAIARLLALYARVVMGTGGRGYGFLASAIGLGAIVASVLVTARATRERLPRNIVGAAFAFSFALALVATARGYVAAFASLAVLGAGQMAFRSGVTTAIQLDTPDRLRGRVISLLTLDFALWSLGAVFSGALADRLGVWHARHAGVAIAWHHDPSAVPASDLAFGIRSTLYVMSALCLISTWVLGRRIVRARRPAAT